MSDYEEIRNLIARYSHYADDQLFEDYRALYASDGELVEEGVAVPADRLPVLMGLYKQMREEQVQPYGGKHLQMNTAIELDGDTATAVTDLLSISLRADTGWTIGGSGRYDDIFVKEDGKWRIKRRSVSWYMNTSAHPGDEEFNRRLAQMMQDAIAAEPA